MSTTPFRSLIIKSFKVIAIIAGLALAALFFIPYFFPDAVSNKVKSWANSSIKGELNFSKARLSFFNHFPSLTFTLYDFHLKGSAPFQKMELLSAKEIALGINLKTLLFNKEIKINKIYLEEALIEIEVNEKGEANYNVYQAQGKKKSASPVDSAGTSLEIEKIVVVNSQLRYQDRSVPLSLEAQGFNYSGRGDLSREIFDLYSTVKIDSLTFGFNQSNYLSHKKINADLITKINTNSISFIFQKNDLNINQLILQFTGKMNFLKNGYDFDLALHSNNSDLHDVINALPPRYVDWLQKTKVKGTTDLALFFKGKYIAESNEKPSLSGSISLRNGYIAYEQAPQPAGNIFLRAALNMPQLNPDSLAVQIDSFSLAIAKGYFQAKCSLRGLDKPFIRAQGRAEIDLEKFDQAFGLHDLHLKGIFASDFRVNGQYATAIIKKGLRQRSDTIVSSIPVFSLHASIKNGYLKYASLPQAVNDINLDMHADCPVKDYHQIRCSIDTLHARIMHSSLSGAARFQGTSDIEVESNILGEIDLADIQQAIPLDSLRLSGKLTTRVIAKGMYAPSKKKFPRVEGLIELHNGFLQTKYYPHPIEHIECKISAKNPNFSRSGVELSITPASFQFEGKPWRLDARLRNPDNIDYDISAKGEVDLEKISKVFPKAGLDLKGSIKADLHLQGMEQDASAGRLDRLHQSGTLEVNNIRFEQQSYPYPFFIRVGKFRFENEKMWFTKFHLDYGKSDFELDGFLTQAVNYFLFHKDKLTGNFNLFSKNLRLDEFSAFSGSDKAPISNDSGKLASRAAGVVILPADLNLVIKAIADNIDYQDLHISGFNGGVALHDGQLQLLETGFTVIGCQAKMDGLYENTSPTRANFQYHIQAAEFDIQRAYQEVKLFHDLVSSAQNAAGILSLDYALSGRLGADMHPIYPSLTGGGTLSIKNAKIKGLKLFNAVSTKTEKKELKDPDLSKIDLKSTIKHNLITIERCKFKTAGFRVRIEGQTSFDNKINFKIRVGLPPLGIIGIPIRVTGTVESPSIKVSSAQTDALSETQDKGDDN